VAEQPPPNGGRDLLGKLVDATFVAIVGSISSLVARGSTGWALALSGIAAAMLATVIILAIEPKKRRAICDRVKRIPVITVLVALGLGFGVGWLVFGRCNTPPPKRDAFIGHIVEWVNGGGQPNTSWLVGTNGERSWIPNPSVFFCLKKEGHTDRGAQSRTVLDDLPDLGQQASCPS
jgi:hypothetical protein